MSPSFLRRLSLFAGWLALAVLLLMLDQATKIVVRASLFVGECVPLTGFFNLVHARNTGAAFSFLSEAGGWQTVFFATIAVVVLISCSVAIWRHCSERFFSLTMAMLASGAAGNLYDRVMDGFVTDFIDLHAFGWHWPAFNVADICICLAALFLVAGEFLRPMKRSS